MILTAQSYLQGDAGSPSLRCPGCRKLGTFERIPIGNDIRLQEEEMSVGVRRCPNPECRAIVYIGVRDGEPSPAFSYPAEQIENSR